MRSLMISGAVPRDESYGGRTGVAHPAVRRPGGDARLSTGEFGSDFDRAREPLHLHLLPPVPNSLPRPFSRIVGSGASCHNY